MSGNSKRADWQKVKLPPLRFLKFLTHNTDTEKTRRVDSRLSDTAIYFTEFVIDLLNCHSEVKWVYLAYLASTYIILWKNISENSSFVASSLSYSRPLLENGEILQL